jgi:hypothetical protein
LLLPVENEENPGNIVYIGLEEEDWGGGVRGWEMLPRAKKARNVFYNI